MDRPPTDSSAAALTGLDANEVTIAASGPSSVLDPAFAGELASEKLWTARIACGMAAVLYALFGVIDPWMIPSALHSVWAIRALVVATCVVALVLTRYEWFLREYQKFALVLPVLWAAAIEAMLYLAAPGDPARDSYYAGLILVVVGFHSWFYLPIVAMTAISAVIVAVYAGVALVVHDVARTGGLPTLVSNLFFLGSAVIICVAVQVRRYRYLLENFQWRQALARDLAAKEQARRQSEHRATHDVLTGLPNRAHFIRLANRQIVASREHGTRLALMFIDLDGFKAINDSHGHAVGDDVLKHLAQRMRGCLKGADTVARLGGDEFGAIVPLAGDTDDDNAGRVARKLLAAVSEPIGEGALRLAVTASIGVALFPLDGTDAQTLVAAADRAMYEVKRTGKAGFRLASLAAART